MTVAPDVLNALADLVRVRRGRGRARRGDALARRGDARGNDPFVVVIDGPAGSGKTTLAAQLAEALGDVPTVHQDDLYEGWEAGPDGGAARLAEWVLAPLASGDRPRYRRFDWPAGEYAEWHEVPPSRYLVIEGCGSGARAVEAHPHLLVWVEADDVECLRRGLARDGDAERDHWLRWMADEAAHYAREQTRERADVRLDGFGAVLAWPADGPTLRP
jgi:hypothetical protein